MNQNHNGTIPVLEHPPGRTHHLAPEDREDVAELMDDESTRRELEISVAKIRRGLKVFLEVGNELMRIRNLKLYRLEAATFEEFCQNRFGFAARYARRLIIASDIAGNLSGAGKGSNWPPLLPANEAQYRPLGLLPPDQWTSAWEEVLQTAPEGVVTARHVQGVVNRRLGKPEAPASGPARSADTIQTDGIRGTAPGTATPGVLPPIDVPSLATREEELRHTAEEVLAKLRELEAKIGAPDSIASSEISFAKEKLEAFLEHLARVEKLQESRA
jgi:hypothetical protein